MRDKTLYICWGMLYGLCVAMSFIPVDQGAQYWAQTALSVIFFVPGAMLLYRAARRGDSRLFRRIRLLSLCSLGATAVLLIVNFLSFDASEAAGTAVYILLILVSAPMICGQIWALSLFLWACLLTVSWSQLRKQAKPPAK